MFLHEKDSGIVPWVWFKYGKTRMGNSFNDYVGGNANSASKTGGTPLHIASYEGHEAVVSMLLREGKLG